MIIEYHGVRPSIGPDVFIAPNATIIGNVTIGAGASIWFGAVLRGDHGRIVVGAGTSVQDNAVIHAPHDDGLTEVGQNVTIGHGAILEGCRIEDGAVVGMSSTVLTGAVVGEQAMLAAGTVVTDGMHIPPRTLAAGVPAQVKKELGGKALEWIEDSTGVYRNLAKSYMFLMEASDESV